MDGYGESGQYMVKYRRSWSVGVHLTDERFPIFRMLYNKDQSGSGTSGDELLDIILGHLFFCAREPTALSCDITIKFPDQRHIFEGCCTNMHCSYFALKGTRAP